MASSSGDGAHVSDPFYSAAEAMVEAISKAHDSGIGVCSFDLLLIILADDENYYFTEQVAHSAVSQELYLIITILLSLVLRLPYILPEFHSKKKFMLH